MNSNSKISVLIEQIVDNLLQEKLRGGFKINEFKSLSHLDEIIAYADKHLQFLGAGSSRMVFILSTSKVLKIAAKKVEAGIEQNKSEVDIYTDPNLKPIVTKVFDAHEKYYWIISELAKPIDTPREFEKLIGVETHNFTDLLQRYRTWVINKGKPTEYRHALTNYYSMLVDSLGEEEATKILINWKNFTKTDTFESIEYLLSKYDMAIGDVVKENSWGITADGRVVLLDYGATMNIILTYY